MISRAALTKRLSIALDALGLAGVDELAPSREASYLLLAAVRGVVPFSEQIVAHERMWTLDGTGPMLARLFADARRVNRFTLGRAPAVRVSSGIIIDVHDTSQSHFMTGIQRVVRSVLPDWSREHEPQLVAWSTGYRSLRGLSNLELARVVSSGAGASHARRASNEIIVPFRATFVLPEIAVDYRRAGRIQSISESSASWSGAVGFDCIPVTTAETAGKGMPGAFARYLASLESFDRVAPISESAATEFHGWREMVHGAGLDGPRIITVELPTATELPHDAERPKDARAELSIGATERVVLSVGSHEPRKNHLALLQAAELSWRAGTEFCLVIVGGNSWATSGFERALARARGRGRRVISLTAADDQLVAALYRTAEFSVFPSLNEGFGLPIVESISSGTPVITSNFGSMRELAEGRGGLLVDPRDDAALADAFTELLGDPVRLAALRAEAAAVQPDDWAGYSRDLWNALTDQTA
jgi:glycosyltransferase involved in cell wall biosynthesis